MPTNDDDTALTTAQAAARLGAAPNSVMAWVDAGLLRAWRTPGGHRRISAASVQAMLEEREARATASREQPTTVMVVEDNPDTAAILVGQLAEILPAARVGRVADGFRALLEAGRAPPDLMITDINLPGMDGLAMIRSLRAQPSTSGLRFLLVSNYRRDELQPFGEVPEGVPLLQKPVSLEALRDAVGRVLGARPPVAP